MVEIIAEIGNTHEGSVELAKCFISEAHNAGVDAVKFQYHIFEEESLDSAPNPPYFKAESRKNYFDRTSFNYEQWLELKKFAAGLNLKFYCSPFSIKAAQILNDVDIDGFKIASGEVTNLPMLAEIAKFQKPIILSSGMSSLAEVKNATNEIISVWPNADLTCLQCTSKYPCPPELAGFRFISDLRKDFNRVGFSDHTLGMASAILAVSCGAEVIEKHFTLSKLMYGPDASFSLEPSEMKTFVHEIRSAYIAVKADYHKNALDEYILEMKSTFQKSIVAKVALPVGTVISAEHLAYKKPDCGISAADYRKILGRTVTADFAVDELLCYEKLK